MRKHLALSVGINRYGHGSDLAGCVNDSNDISAWLRAQGYDVAQLLDQDATKYRILVALRDLVDSARYGDRVVFHYSGHGTWVPDRDGDEPDRRDEAICPVDVWSNGPLLDDDMHEVLARRRRGVRIHALFDSCYSGTMERAISTLPNTGRTIPADSIVRPRFLAPRAWMPEALVPAGERAAEGYQRALVPSAWVSWTAALDVETACDAVVRGRPCGAGTYTLLRALETAGEGASWEKVHAEVRRQLPSSEWPQTPTLAASWSQRRWPALL